VTDQIEAGTREHTRTWAFGKAVALLFAVWGGTYITRVLEMVYTDVGTTPLAFPRGQYPFAVQIVGSAVVAAALGVTIPWLAVGARGLCLTRDSREKRWTLESWLVPIVSGIAFMYLAERVYTLIVTHELLPTGPRGGYTSSSPLTGWMFGSTAGFYEEPVIVAVIGILALAKVDTRVIFAVVVVARCLFHAHVGLAGIIPVAMWTTGYFALWWVYRNLPALVLAHALFYVVDHILPY
jgi:hypothetical protein